MMPTPKSLGRIFWDTRVATEIERSHCGIKSGIEIESLIVELDGACQAKVSGTLKQTAYRALPTG